MPSRCSDLNTRTIHAQAATPHGSTLDEMDRWLSAATKVKALNAFHSALGGDSPTQSDLSGGNTPTSPSPAGAQDPTALASVSVDSFEPDVTGAFHNFVCSVQTCDGTFWKLQARFRQFRALWKVMARELPGLPFTRRLRTALSDEELQVRRFELDRFMQTVLAASQAGSLSNDAIAALHLFVGASAPEQQQQQWQWPQGASDANAVHTMIAAPPTAIAAVGAGCALLRRRWSRLLIT